MGRYTLGEKLEAVRSYCAGELGQKAVTKQYNVDVSSLRQWIATYRAHGIEGLKEKKRAFYSADFKLNVLRRVEEERLSHRQAAALFDIRKFDIIGHWSLEAPI